MRSLAVLLLFASPAGAFEVEAWMDRCFAYSDELFQRSLAAENALMIMGVVGSNDNNCVINPIDFCQFSEDPKSCLGRVRAHLQTRLDETVAVLPEEISGAGFTARGYKRQLTALHEDLSEWADTECIETFEAGGMSMDRERFALEAAPFTLETDYCPTISLVLSLTSARSLKRMAERAEAQ